MCSRSVDASGSIESATILTTYMLIITNACESVCMHIQVAALSHDELVSYLQRRSDGFSKGSSKFRGVSRHKQRGKWDSQITRQGKYVNLGYYNAEFEAAQAYDRAAIRCKGKKAVTNFDMNEYKDELAEFEDRRRKNHALLA